MRILTKRLISPDLFKTLQISYYMVKPGAKIVTILFYLLSIPALGQRLTVNYSNQPLSTALNSLSHRYNLKIAFDAQVANKTIITKTISKASVDEALILITEGTGLKVQRMGDVYMIIPDEKKAIPAENPPIQEKKVTEKLKMYISGIVKDRISGEVLPYASIYLSKNHIGAATNADGYFMVEMSSADTTFFILNYVGYSPAAFQALPQTKPVLRTYLLDPRIEEIQAIEVKDRVEVFDNTGLNVDRLKFSPSKMSNIPSLTELDILAPLQMLPGINGTNENTGGLSIRKSSPDKSLMIYDGFTLYHLNHFFGAFSSINTKAIKDVQIYKSGFGPQYGGSVAGIVEITGKSGNMQKPVIDIGADMLAVDAKAEIPIVKNKCSFLFSGRRSYADVVKTPLFNTMFENARYDFTSYYKKPPVAFTSNAGDPVYYYNDYSTKLTFRPSESHVISVSGFGSFDKLGFQQLEVYPKINENTKWGTRGGGIRWAGKFTPSWNSELLTGISKTSFDYAYYDSIIRIKRIGQWQVTNRVFKSAAIESWLTNGTVTWNNTIEVFKGQQIETGVTTQSFQSSYHYNAQAKLNARVLLDTLRLYDHNARLSSTWFQYKLSGEKWSLKPGIRFSWYSITKKTYPELRVSGIYKVGSSLTMKANAGNYYQFVSKVNIVQKGDYRSVWAISDGDRIPVISSSSVSGGFNYAVFSNLDIDVELYYKKTDNLITPIERYRLVDGQVKLVKANLLYDSEVQGIDLFVKQTFGNYQLWGSYTFSKSVSKIQKKALSRTFPSDDDQLHELKLLNLLKIKNCVLSLSGIYGSGGVWDEHVLDDDLQLSSEYQRNNAGLPEYFRIDAGLNYSLHVGKVELKIGSNFYNILDNKNVINRFDQLSDTPLLNISQGLSPLEVNTVYGLGFSYNVFINLVF